MKQNKKRIGGLFASLCTAALLLGGVPSFAERTSGGECTGPTVDNDCSCTNTVQCKMFARPPRGEVQGDPYAAIKEGVVEKVGAGRSTAYNWIAR